MPDLWQNCQRCSVDRLLSGKKNHPSPAKDLYTSPWFKKARAFVEQNGDQWYILSAEHGLVHPGAEVTPYERTLNKMGIAERRHWAARVLDQLLPLLDDVDQVIILAGERYREFILDEIRAKVKSVEIPMKGLPIGKQLAWLKKELAQPQEKEMNRQKDLERLYELLARLEVLQGGKRTLASCTSRDGWPTRGIYFFFEEGENRTDSGAGHRIVRVGTHGLKTGSKSTLWNRLSQHQGVQSSGSGNHRGSIFRLLVGQALTDRNKLDVPSWGIGGSISAAAKRQSLTREAVKESELPIEQQVSKLIGDMPFLWLDIDDAPGPDSLRGYLERNTISLVSNHGKEPLDPPSKDWLGLSSNREKVRQSALWNSNHVDEDYDPAFLDVLERQISGTVPGKPPSPTKPVNKRMPEARSEDTYLKSTFYEQLVEHAFISELLQETYFRFGHTLEILRSEIDASGYDLVLECNGFLRHVQLKTSASTSSTAVQKVHTALASKPGGCVVWIIRHEDPESCRMRLSYRFFGSIAGNPLPSLTGLTVAKHTKGDASGKKRERPAIRILPKAKFRTIETTTELVTELFGL